MGLFDWLRGLTGSKPDADRAPPAPLPDSMLVRSQQRRDAFWADVGALERDVLGHVISPGLRGGPRWPATRQAYRIARRAGGTVLLATDGMSDPFDDDGAGRAVNGFECELFLETGDLAPDQLGAPGNIEPLKHSWAFELLTNIAATIAEAEGARAAFDAYGVLSIEVPGVSRSHAIKDAVPARFVTSDDAIGVLVGGPAPDFPERIDDMPLSPVRLLPVVLLTAAELAEIRAGDEETRTAIADRLAQSISRHRCDFVRASIVEAAD
ncbi:hypothetical protein [Sphingomonas sp.]|uniref:hypothetical protein n=1 Tax=Sphingomonas sp. TaxID=28214 RepID=UPI0031E3FA2B